MEPRQCLHGRLDTPSPVSQPRSGFEIWNFQKRRELVDDHCGIRIHGCCHANRPFVHRKNGQKHCREENTKEDGYSDVRLLNTCFSGMLLALVFLHRARDEPDLYQNSAQVSCRNTHHTSCNISSG